MAKLQKKKLSHDKNKKNVITTENIEKKHLDSNSSSSTSSRTFQAVGFKNTKDMIAQNVIENPNFFQKSVQFLREVQAELKKVTWPNRKQSAGATLVVIILVFIIAAFLGLIDVTLSKLVQVILA